MPSVNLRKPLYDELVRQGDEPKDAVNEAVEQYLNDEHGVEVDA